MGVDVGMASSKYGVRKSFSRLQNLNLAQGGTIRDLQSMLDKHQIALMIRPTGFGKTYTMIKLCEAEKYQRIVYLYPTNIIKDSILQDYHSNGVRKFTISNSEHKEYPDLPFIEFVSYSKMLQDWRNPYRNTDITESKWLKLSDEDKLKVQKKWLKQRFSGINLLILDEAHMTGAEGFMEYWPYLHELALNRNKRKDERLNIVGATATPLRTSLDVDIEKDIFYYTYGGKKKSAKIPDFSIIDCWDYNILTRPIYTKGILDKDAQQEDLERALYEGLLGSKSNGAQEIIGRDTKQASAVHVVSNPYLDSQRRLYETESAEMRSGINSLPEPYQVLKNGIMQACENTYINGKYMRFLVFYQNTEDLIKYHEDINNAVRKALDIQDGSRFKQLNVSYIVTNEKAMEKAGIQVSSTDDLTDRNNQLSSVTGKDKDGKDIHYDSDGQVDIIHSIDILNMGYHVGKVTGVIIKRATGSEIKYYQEIGRCMSVRDSAKPLIVDFSNADSELYQRSTDTLRDEAVERIKEFINACEISGDAEKLNSIYSKVKMNISMDYIPEELIEYYYFDRKAPIYFIKGIAESRNCLEGVKSIVGKLYSICLSKYTRDKLRSDTYALTETRLNVALKGKKPQGLMSIILQIDDAVADILKQTEGGEENA